MSLYDILFARFGRGSLYDLLFYRKLLGSGTLIGTDTEPYIYRHAPALGAYKSERDEVVGVSVGFNQSVKLHNISAGGIGIAITAGTNNRVVINGTASRNVTETDYFTPIDRMYIPAKHIIYTSGVGSNKFVLKYIGLNYNGAFINITNEGISKALYGVYETSMLINEGTAFDNETIKMPIIIDLTAMLGSTIADYIYTLEQGTAGAGVAFFRKYFSADYYPFDSGSIRSVEGLVSHTMRDENDNIIGEYPLDSTVTLRGLLQLDNGKLKADGDTYEANGTVTRNWASGSITTASKFEDETGYFWYTTTTDLGLPAIKGLNAGLLADRLIATSGISQTTDEGTIVIYANGIIRWKEKGTMSQADYRTYLASNPIEIVYEKSEPTTETAQPFAKTQKVSPNGTEEYVTSSVVPVGHNTEYYG